MHKRLVYASPFVPAEWIAAHELEPFRLFPASPSSTCEKGQGEGLCPFAQAFAAQASACQPAAAIFATTCDQMRRASELVVPSPSLPAVFLFNVPATWRSTQANALYREELLRLGRFLVRLGGARPAPEQLAEVMLSYDDARQDLRQARENSSAREAAEALVSLYQNFGLGRGGPGEARGSMGNPQSATRNPQSSRRVALLGGPVFREQFGLYDEIERGGARLVLDATETGERTLPAPFDRARLRDSPLEELARAYFQHIPDVFRRPNDRLYEWLAMELSARHVQGILLLRCVWCDLWHAEVPRLKERLNLPVLELEPSGLSADTPRTQVRLEAFLEVLT